ncbi:MAG: thiamine diphosphokinase [Candidatus Neomarinimicrobiota bacterium]
MNSQPLKFSINDPVVILAGGQFPTHQRPLQVLHAAGFLICTDGSADRALDSGLRPDLVIGDLDSIGRPLAEYPCPVIAVATQDDTDLEKALNWCLEQQIHLITLTGLSGGGDDHALANLLILNAYSDRLEVRAISDYFTIDCLSGKREFASVAGQRVSLLALEQSPAVTTSGLLYNLDNEPLPVSGRGISNRAGGTTFRVRSTGKILIFRAHPE